MDEQSNNMLIPEPNVYLAKEAESAVNDKENNIASEHEIKKRKSKEKKKAKKKKHMEFKWSKRPKSNHKKSSDLEVERVT